MNNRILRSLLTSLLVLPALAQAPAPEVQARMEQVLQHYTSHHEFMGSALVAREGKVLLSKGYGSANLEWKIPNSPATKFRLGSITKQFTAASILLLQERGKLSLQDPVKKYLPDAPAAWDKVTIFHLLTHTSGIPNFTSFPEYPSLNALATTPEKLVARFRDKSLEFQPGEKWAYSNSGYVLLGYLLEKISGQGYAAFLQQNLFDPLGMKDSGYDSSTMILPARASGYAPGPEGPQNAAYAHMSIPFSAGALYSTTEDLLRWEQALFGGKLLKPESLKQMTTPFKSDYGLGLAVHAVKGHKVVEHGGGIEGFNTQLSYYPDEHLAVIVLGNLNGGAPGAIAEKLAAAALGEQVVLPIERKEVVVDSKILEGYVGNYQLAPGVIGTVTREGGRLFGQLTDQPRFELFAESDRDFFLKAVDAQVTFEVDAQGRASRLVLHQNGDHVAVRIEGEMPLPKARKEVAVAAKVLDGYVGQYELAPGFIMTFIREGERFFTQATGQPKCELFAEGDRDFFLKVVNAQITFEVDATGRATGLVLHQGGDHPAKRID